MPPLASGYVENEKQNPTAGNVTEKIMAETDVPMRALDQSRNVRDRSAAVAIELDHADNRMEGRERIRRHLWMGRGDFSKQR